MNIVIIGGGLAGWLTSLYAINAVPQAHVGVIDSSEIGILGAGEGSTPSFVSIMNYVGINVEDLVKETKATLKNGIRYIGWSQENPDYFHGFDPEFKTRNVSQRSYKSHVYEEPPIYSLYLENLFRKDHIDQFNFMARLSRFDKVPITHEKENVAPYGLHFDSSLIAAYLKSSAIQRGVKHFSAKVTGFNSDENGYIESVNLEDGIVLADIVFDCTGLHRAIISEFDVDWISFSDQLPMKKAIPFQLDAQPFPHTGAVAMSSGWMWQIPLQHRTGAGYVFDTDFISEEGARQELFDKYSIEADAPAFTIDPGIYKSIWNKNVIAIGLSGGFLEPLEASSIWLFTRNLERFFRDRNNLFTKDEGIRREYNKIAVKDMQETADFIRLHYMTDRSDTDFWKNVNQYSISDGLSEILEISKSRPPYEAELLGNSRMYWDSYYQIMFGNNLVDKKVYLEYYENTMLDGEAPFAYNALLNRQDLLAKKCMDLSEYLEEVNA